MIARRSLLLGFGGLLAGGRALAQTPAGPAPAPPPAVDADDLPSLLTATGAPAVGGMVVTPTGVSWLQVAGRRRLDQPDPVTREDKWHLGSNTKAMSAALYAKLVEGGRARWGATVGELFPDVTIDPAFRGVTIEQLLGHRSGIQDAPIVMGGWLMRAHRDTRPIEQQRAELAAQVLGAAPTGAPGAFAYSNVGYVIAGAAMERITGRRWEDAMSEGLFQPLGMTSAGFGPPEGAQPSGHAGAQPMPTQDNPVALGPAGRSHMSLTDYAKFLRLFLTRGRDYLQPASVEKLTTALPVRDGERPYALGWGAAPDRPWARGPALSHEGSNTMWHAFAAVAPARGLAIATVSNGEPGGTQATQTLGRALIARFAPV